MSSIIWNTEQCRRLWFPYAVQKVNDAIGGWIILNRHYKPLGAPSNRWVKYEGIPPFMRIKRITRAQQRKLDHGERLAAPLRLDEIIWLYHDSIIPTSSQSNWTSYQKRLFILARLDCFGADKIHDPPLDKFSSSLTKEQRARALWGYPAKEHVYS